MTHPAHTMRRDPAEGSSSPLGLSADPIPDEVVLAAVETMLKAVGNPVLRYYMPGTQARAMEAMRGLLTAEREHAAAIVDELVAWAPSDKRRDKLVLTIASRAIRRGRNLTDKERLDNLMNFLAGEDEDAAALGGKGAQ